MTRENAKELLPIIEAYANGATIETQIIKGCWNVEKYPTFCLNANKYRIKSEPSYQPFKDAEECWNEMFKHQPFGWIKTKSKYPTFILINLLDDSDCSSVGYSSYLSFEDFF